MSEVLKNLGTKKTLNKKEAEKQYDEYLDDPLTFSIDEILQTLGPRRETLN